jgi:hypothetical protein
MTERQEYPKIDMDALERGSWMWRPAPRLRWYRPKGGSDNDMRLEQMWERISGEQSWRTVQTILGG